VSASALAFICWLLIELILQKTQGAGSLIVNIISPQLEFGGQWTERTRGISRDRASIGFLRNTQDLWRDGS